MGAVLLCAGGVLLVLGLLMLQPWRLGDPSGSAGDGRAFFTEHETELEQVAEMVADGRLVRPEGRVSYLGPALPRALSNLSATGHVAIQPSGDFFLPQWTGIPDDAGGIWHSAASPEGQDMYGLGCRHPLHVKGDWWLCGMDPGSLE